MIDGIKAILFDNLDEVHSSPFLDFKKPAEISVTTGEIEEGKFPIAKYKGLLLEDKDTNIEIRGSIHKLHNMGEHNYNRFGLSEIHLTLYDLAKNLKIVTDKAKLSNIEFGVNLHIEFEPKIFLNSLIIHKGKKFNYRERFNMHYKECIHSQYYIKIYDKGLQYGLSQFIIRIELKFIKMEKINGFGINYLSDLLNPIKLKKLQNELLKVYDDILIGDITAKPKGLSRKDDVLFANGHNPEYWDNLLPRSIDYINGNSDKNYRKDSRIYERKLSRFKKILSDTGSDYKKIIIRQLIESECEKLLSISRKKSIQINPKLNQKRGKLTNLGILELGKKTWGIDQQFINGNKEFDQHFQKQKTWENDSLIYSVKNTQKDNQTKKYCKVTGLDISIQKDDSRFLCVTGIKYYKKNHPEIWLQLWKRLSPRWYGCSEETQIREIHHSIRNEYFNKIHNTKKSIQRITRHPALFNQMELISKEKLKLAAMAG